MVLLLKFEIEIKVKLFIYSQTSMVQLLKFGNG